MPYTFQLEHLTVRCDTEDEAWALLARVLERKSAEPPRVDLQATVDNERLNAALEDTRQQLVEATVENQELKRQKAKLLVAQPSEPKTKTARWREQIREHLERNDPCRQAELSRLFDVPTGSISPVMCCPLFARLDDQRYTTPERVAEFTTQRSVAEDDPPKTPAPATRPGFKPPPAPEQIALAIEKLRQRIQELLADRGALDARKIAMCVATPKHLVEKALDDPRFVRVDDSDQYANASTADAGLVESIARYLKANGPTRYAFIAAAIHAELPEVVEALKSDDRFEQRPTDGAWYLEA